MQLQEQLKNAQCDTPFEFLGPSFSNETCTIRTWLPNAKRVQVFELQSGRVLGELQKTAKSELFEGQFENCDDSLVYGLRVENDDTEY